MAAVGFDYGSFGRIPVEEAKLWTFAVRLKHFSAVTKALNLADLGISLSSRLTPASGNLSRPLDQSRGYWGRRVVRSPPVRTGAIPNGRLIGLVSVCCTHVE